MQSTGVKNVYSETGPPNPFPFILYVIYYTQLMFE